MLYTILALQSDIVKLKLQNIKQMPVPVSAQAARGGSRNEVV